MNPETRQRIAAFLLGELSHPESELLRAEAAADPALARQVDAMRCVLGDLDAARTAEPLFEVSPASRERLLGLYQAPAPALVGLVRSLIARLSLDSFAGSAALAPVRGGTSTGRRLVFQVDGIEIDLRLEPAAGVPHGREVDVLGCIQGMTAPRVVTFRPLEPSASAPITMSVALDGFFEGRVPAGLMSIEIESPDVNISVPSAEIRVEAPGTR